MQRGAAASIDAQTSRESRRAHLVGLDGLRAIAALSVLTGHVWQHLDPQLRPSAVGSWILAHLEQGLTLFFALSGFLLYLPFVSRLAQGRDTPSTRQFYFNRIVRIFPAYIVVLLLASYLMQATYVTSPQLGDLGSVGAMTQPLQVVSNLLLVQALIPMTMGTGLGVSWSLTTELCFYAVLPVLGLLAMKVARRFRPSLIAALAPPALLFFIGGASQVLGILWRSGSAEQQYAMSWGSTWAAVVDRSLLSTAHLFAFGMFAAVLYSATGLRVLGWKPQRTRATVWLLVLVAAISATLAPAALAFGLASAAFIALATLPTASGQASSVARVLEVAPLRALGSISYSIYLWHVPVLNFMETRGMGADVKSWVGIAGWWSLVLLVTVALATATYLGVERPCMRLRDRTKIKRHAR